jgi:hypothetical protein
MRLSAIVPMTLLSLIATHAGAEQGDAEDRVLIDQYVAQRAQLPVPETKASIVTTKDAARDERAPTAASAP